MANLAVTDNSNLCKNNYYNALASEYVPNPPPHIPPSHTGIADSGASSFYFAPNAPVTNYSSLAPKIGVRVANGLPERWVAAPFSHRHLPSLKRQCQDMLCRPSCTPSSAWVPLLTKDAPLSSPQQQSLSTIPMVILSLQVGASKQVRASGTSRSPNTEQPPRLRPPSQHRWKPSRHHHRALSLHPQAPSCPGQLDCPRQLDHLPRHIPAKESWPPTLREWPVQSITSMAQPRR
jgi:hypothetical protein